MDTTADVLVDRFLETQRGVLSPATVKAYAYDLTDTFARVAANRGCDPAVLDVSTVTVDELEAVVAGFRANDTQQRDTDRGQRRAPATIARRVSAVRRFFGWGYARGFLTADVSTLLASPRANRPQPRNFPVSLAVRILDAAGENTTWPERDRLIVALGLVCGLRQAEIAGIEDRDVVGDPPTRIVVKGKGGKERVVHLPEVATEMIVAYRPTRRDRLDRLGVDAATLIVSSRTVTRTDRDGNPVRVAPVPYYAVGEVVDRVLRQVAARSSGMRVHALRHTFATLALSSGALNIRQLQVALGHASLATTQRYIDVADEELAAGMRMHPLANR